MNFIFCTGDPNPLNLNNNDRRFSFIYKGPKKMKIGNFQRRQTTIHAYYDEAIALFGENTQNWKFVCPVCGHTTSVSDYQDAGAPEGAIAFSCVGRWTNATQTFFDESGDGTGPCDYAGGGLFDFNPVQIEDFGNYFEFAKPEATPPVLSGVET